MRVRHRLEADGSLYKATLRGPMRISPQGLISRGVGFQSMPHPAPQGVGSFADYMPPV